MAMRKKVILQFKFTDVSKEKKFYESYGHIDEEYRTNDNIPDTIVLWNPKMILGADKNAIQIH